MNIELLSRLNAKSQDIRMLPPGFDQLTPADISHAISLFHTKGARLLARVIYADQPTFARELQHELLGLLKQRAKDEHWYKIGPLKKLSEVAVTVYCRPQRCHKCNGAGERKWGAKVVRCPACTKRISLPGEPKVEVSHGWKRVYFSDVALQIGITKETMARTWKRRYGLAISTLMKWDEQCWDGFGKALRNRQRSA